MTTLTIGAAYAGFVRTWSLEEQRKETYAASSSSHFLRPIHRFGGPKRHDPDATVRCLRFNHNGKVVVTGGSDGKIVLNHIRGHCLGTLPIIEPPSSSTTASSRTNNNSNEADGASIGALCFSSGSRYLVSGDDDGLLKIWDLKRKAPIRTFRDHRTEYHLLREPSLTLDGVSLNLR